MTELKTLKEVASVMRLNPQTAGRWLKRLKHKPTVENRHGGYRFDAENEAQFLDAWTKHKFKKRRATKRKRKR